MVLKLLDLFCGGGGAADGYATVFDEIVGVDIKRQPFYPYRFEQEDALEFLATVKYGDFDLIHASPPCQGYSRAVSSPKTRNKPRLIGRVRTRLLEIGTPFVIENVVGARFYMRQPTLLCGTMFEKPVIRHRLFEAGGWQYKAPQHPKCRGVAVQFARENGWNPKEMYIAGTSSNPQTRARWAILLGLSPGRKMRIHDMTEAIPPYYTKHIAESFMQWH